jgi:hypothetical protein
MWDESEHVSPKRVKQLSTVFWKNYAAMFPEGTKTAESPMILSTESPILGSRKITSFLHEGRFIPHSGKNKDLALVKYCSIGLMDQDEHFHFVLDDLRNQRHLNGEPPLVADEAAMVLFVTSDWAKEMLKAINYVQTKAKTMKTNFAHLRVPKVSGENDKRIAVVGQIIGKELKKRFVRHEQDGLLLDVEG